MRSFLSSALFAAYSQMMDEFLAFSSSLQLMPIADRGGYVPSRHTYADPRTRRAAQRRHRSGRRRTQLRRRRALRAARH